MLWGAFPEAVFARDFHSVESGLELKSRTALSRESFHFTADLSTEFRPWRSDFRERLADGATPLSADRLVLLRKNIERAVRTDPRAEYRLGESGTAVVFRLRTVTEAAIRRFGIDRPTVELRQLAAMEATGAFVIARSRYDHESLREDGTVTYRSSGPLSQYFARRPIPIVCEEACEFMRDLLTEWRRQVDDPRFAVEATVIRGHVSWTDPGLMHAWNGVAIRHADGGMTKLFFDPTPPVEPSVTTDDRPGRVGLGPLSQEGVELFLSEYRPYDVDVRPQDRIGKRSPEALEALREDVSRFASGWLVDSPHLRPEERFWTGLPVGRTAREDAELEAEWRETIAIRRETLASHREERRRIGWY